MKSSSIAIAILIVFSLTFCEVVAQGDQSSLNIIDFESGINTEASVLVAIEKLLNENRKLKAEAEEAQRLRAAATAEAEVFKRQVHELARRMEALGASTANPSALEQRVLQAANALHRSESALLEHTNVLLRFAEVVAEYKRRPDSDAKMALESEQKRVDELLAKAAAGEALEAADRKQLPPSGPGDGKVSAVKAEIGCIVINLGSKQGVKPNMPFEVKRGNKQIATVRVVDVRQTFAGTVIQNLVSDKEPVAVGDVVRIGAQVN